MTFRWETVLDKDSYRFDVRLRFVRGTPEKAIAFVMLNPSVAGAKDDDPTIRRCKSFYKDLGYTGMIAVNLFPIVSTNPKALVSVYNSRPQINLMSLNDAHILDAVKNTELTICAWGCLRQYRGDFLRTGEERFFLTFTCFFKKLFG